MNASPYLAFVVLLLGLQALANFTQVGHRFPMGVSLGGGGNCSTDPQDVGLLRFHNGTVQVCGEDGAWHDLAQTDLEDINTRLRALETGNGTLPGGSDVPTLLNTNNVLLSRSLCSNHGDYDTETRLCTCDCDFAHGCWEYRSLCSVCESGWTGTTCHVDIENPTISLLGGDPLTVEARVEDTEWAASDPGVKIIDNGDSESTLQSLLVVSDDGFSRDTIGTYTITYDVTDTSGNAAASVSRTVEVVDTTPPTIVLTGDNPLTVEAAATYDDPGYTAADNSVPLSVSIDDGVDSTTTGEYNYTVSAEDSAGLTFSISRTVVIVDTTAPAIEFVDPRGTETPNAFVWPRGRTPFAFFGSRIVVVDIVDGEDTDGSFLVSSYDAADVDINTVGTYSLHINVTDLHGNSAIRTVSVEVEVVPLGTEPFSAGVDCGELLEDSAVFNYTDDVYWLQPGGVGGALLEAYCHFDLDAGVGWTLVMKHASNDFTFEYESTHWEDPLSTVNPTDLSIAVGVAKLEAFNSVRVSHVRGCVGSGTHPSHSSQACLDFPLGTAFASAQNLFANPQQIHRGPSRQDYFAAFGHVCQDPNNSQRGFTDWCGVNNYNPTLQETGPVRLGWKGNCNGPTSSSDDGSCPGFRAYDASEDLDGTCGFGVSKSGSNPKPTASTSCHDHWNPESRKDAWIWVAWVNASAEAVGTENNPGDSCAHILSSAASAPPSGPYWIQPAGAAAKFQVYCDMETDGGGWTLVMKHRTSDLTFQYSSNYWTDTNNFSETQMSGSAPSAAKFESFNSLSFSTIRGCVASSSSRCLQHTFSQSYSSARDLFSDGWKNEGNPRNEVFNAFQWQCNEHQYMDWCGFSATSGTTEVGRVRWGWLGNCNGGSDDGNSCPTSHSTNQDTDGICGFGIDTAGNVNNGAPFSSSTSCGDHWTSPVGYNVWIYVK